MTDTTALKLEYALRLAKLGFHILPCQANSKNPKQGFRYGVGATTNPDKIKEWFADDPAMNYGVCPRDKGVVIDLDIKPERGIDGRDTWANTLLENDDNVETFTVQSPSGGLHFYFNTEVEVGNAHNFGKSSGVDVRGTGGYVVGPGCTLDNGSYAVTGERDIASAPGWLVNNYLKQPGAKSDNSQTPVLPLDLGPNIAKAEEFLSSHAPAVEGLNGNSFTYETAQWVRDFGISEAKCLELMFSTGWNDRCEPPWSAQELEVCIRNAYRYGQNRPGEKADLMTMFEEQLSPEETQALLDSAVVNHTLNNNIKIYSSSEFAGRGIRREYIIPGWLPAHGFTAINAARGTGKSAIMLDLACRIACDMDWGNVPIDKGFTSVYLCGEDDEGLELNLTAWMEEEQLVPDERMFVADGVSNLMSRESVENLLRAIREKMGSNRKCVVFLDTWQRATMAAGQNKDEDMQLCIKHAEQLAAALGGPLVVAFHPPKDGRKTIMGSSIIENSSTAIWQVEETSRDRIRLEVTRIKGPGRYNTRDYELRIFDLKTTDAFGKPETGLIPICIGGTDENTDQMERAREEDLKRAWGWLIAGVDNWLNTQVNMSAAKKLGQMKRYPLGEKVEELYLNDDEWRKIWGEKFDKLGEKMPKPQTVATRFENIFFKNPKDPCQLENGQIISVDGDRLKVSVVPEEQKLDEITN